MHDITLRSRTPIKLTMPARLQELRELVLQRSTKRMPKWKFRLAPDVVVMIQPKVAKGTPVAIRTGLTWARVSLSLRFAGEVLVCEGADADKLTKRHGRGAPYWLQKFLIGTNDAGEPVIIGDGVNGSMGASDPVERNERRDAFDRKATGVLFAALGDGRFETIDATVMLSPHCLLCGKALTDSASMARFIGPECAGTTSTKVPHTVLLDRMASANIFACKREEDGTVTETPMAKDDVALLIYDAGDGEARARVRPKVRAKPPGPVPDLFDKVERP